MSAPPEPSTDGGTLTAVAPTPPETSATSGEASTTSGTAGTATAAGTVTRGPSEVAPEPGLRDTTEPTTLPSAEPSAEPTQPSTEPQPEPNAGQVPSGTHAGAHAHRRHRRRPWRWIVTVVLLVLLLGGAGYAGVYLYQTSQAWQERSEEYLRASQGLGEELATSETALAGARSELEAVRAQLATAQTRIVELADEKAQLGDDREVQRQLVDYQQRISEAAGQVALALDQCVQGQNQLIGYMENAAQYDPAELEQFGTDVQALCQAATDANAALQRELAP